MLTGFPSLFLLATEIGPRSHYLELLWVLLVQVRIIVVYTSTNAYGFSQFTASGNGDWTTQSLSGSPIDAISR